MPQTETRIGGLLRRFHGRYEMQKFWGGFTLLGLITYGVTYNRRYKGTGAERKRFYTKSYRIELSFPLGRWLDTSTFFTIYRGTRKPMFRWLPLFIWWYPLAYVLSALAVAFMLIVSWVGEPFVGDYDGPFSKRYWKRSEYKVWFMAARLLPLLIYLFGIYSLARLLA